MFQNRTTSKNTNLNESDFEKRQLNGTGEEERIALMYSKVKKQDPTTQGKD